MTDLGYIMTLQFTPENRKFIVPFDEDYHRAIINSDGAEKLDIIIEEIDTGLPAGYFMLRELDSPCAEYTHVIIGRKGLGYGREALKLLLAWTFETKKFHRVWIDCKGRLNSASRISFARSITQSRYIFTRVRVSCAKVSCAK